MMPKNIISKSIAILLAIALIICDISYAAVDKLAPPLLFQKSSPDERSEDFRKSVLSDMKALSAAFSIASHFLIDNKNKRTLPRAIRDEFRNNPSFLEGVDLDNVRRDGFIVYIPYRKNGINYEVRVCSKEKLKNIGKEPSSHWAVSANWAIQVAAPHYRKVLVFDWDGTIADTMETWKGIWNDLYFNLVNDRWPSDLQKPFIQLDDFFKKSYGRGIEENIRELIKITGKHGLNKDKIADDVKSYAYTKLVDRPKIFEFVREAMQQARSMGVIIYVVSASGQKILEESIENAGLEKLIPKERIFSTADSPYKNKEDAINYIMSKEGVSADEMVMTGDSDVDRAAAENTGLTFVDVLAHKTAESILDCLLNRPQTGYNNLIRPLNTAGEPGDLIDIELKEGRIVIIGDLHAKIDNLELILSQKGVEEGLADGTLRLIFLGDYCLPTEEDLKNFPEVPWGKNGFDVFVRLTGLENKYPGRVHILRGNGEMAFLDYYKTNLNNYRKSPDKINPKAKGFYDYIINNYGESKLGLVKDFFSTMPLFLKLKIGDRTYLLSHGVIIGGINDASSLTNFTYDNREKNISELFDEVNYNCIAKKNPSDDAAKESALEGCLKKLGIDCFITGHTHPYDTQRDKYSVYNFKPISNVPALALMVFDKLVVFDSLSAEPDYLDISISDTIRSQELPPIDSLKDASGNSAFKSVTPLSGLKNEKVRRFVLNSLRFSYGSLHVNSEIPKDIVDVLSKAQNVTEAIQEVRELLKQDTGFKRIYKKYKKEGKTGVIIEYLKDYLEGDKTIVDIGCGNNSLAQVICENNSQLKVIGVDPYSEPAESAKGEINDASKGVKFTRDIQNIDDNTTDVVLMIGSAHYLESGELQSYLENIKRILKPDGRFIILNDTYNDTPPPGDDLAAEFSKLSLTEKRMAMVLIELIGGKIIPEAATEGEDKNYGRPFNFRTIDEWQKLLAENGFAAEQSKYIGFPKGLLHVNPKGLLPFKKSGIEKIDEAKVAEKSKKDRSEAAYTADGDIKTGTKVIKIPDFSEISFKEILARAQSIEQYYNGLTDDERQRYRRIESEHNSKKRVTYFLGIAVLTKDGPRDDYKIIKHKKIYGPAGEYEGELLIYYNNRENAVTVLLEGPNEHALINAGSDTERGERGWDRAVVKVYLDGSHDRISIINHETAEMCLSRTAMAIMLEDALMPAELPDLYQAMESFFVFPPVNDMMRHLEKENEKTVPLSIVDKVNKDSGVATPSDIKALEGFVYYKSWAIRELALNALRNLARKGIISKTGLERTERLFESNHIAQDLAFIERLLVKDPDLIEEVIHKLSGQKVERRDVSSIKVNWYKKGRYKNIFKIRFILKDGRDFLLAVSTIRSDPIGTGYDARAIDKAMEGWKMLLSKALETVPKIGADRWVLDLRPTIVDIPIPGRREADDPEGIGKNRWVYDNIHVVFREFVEEKDLEEVLSDTGLSQAEKKKAVKAALQTYLDTWNKTKDSSGKGLFIGDPKPANIVICSGNGQYKAKIIDLDALRGFDNFESVKETIRMYPEYDDFDVVYVNGKAKAVEKAAPQNKYYKDAEAGLKKTKELIAQGRLTMEASQKLCQTAARNFTSYYQETNQILRPAIEIIGEIVALDDAIISKPATSALFGGIIEPLMDAFLPEGRVINNQLFIHIVDICRRKPAGRQLDDKLNKLGFISEEMMQDWCARAREPHKFDLTRKNRIKKIIVFSRVTKGADISITSILLERMKREFPNAEIVYIAPARQKELFAQDPRINIRPIRFLRRGSLVSRLNSWIELCDIIEDEVRGIEDDALILDPDSRLSQLAAMPMPVKAENYLFFNSSRRPEEKEDVLSLSECVTRWLDETFGKAKSPVYPKVYLPEQDRQFAAGVFDRLGLKQRFVIGMNLGVGGNEGKRISPEFDAKLVRKLLDSQSNSVLILDKGGPFLSGQGRLEEMYVDKISRDAVSGLNIPIVEVVKIPDGRILILPGLCERSDSESEGMERKIHRVKMAYRDAEGNVAARWTEVAELMQDGEEVTTLEDYWQAENLGQIIEQTINAFFNSPKGLIIHRGGVGMLGSLIEHSDYYIGYDSMGQHLAAALGVPETAIFAGFTNEIFLARWHPYGKSGKSSAEIIAVDTLHTPMEKIDEAKIINNVLKTVVAGRAKAHIARGDITPAQYDQMAINSYAIARVIAQLNDQKGLAQGLTEDITRFQNFGERSQIINPEVMDTILKNPEVVTVLSGLKWAQIVDFNNLSQKSLEDLKYLLWALKHRTGKAARIMPLANGKFYIYDEEYLRYIAPDEDKRIAVTRAGLEILILRSVSQRKGIYYELSQSTINPAVLNLAQQVFESSFYRGAKFTPSEKLNIDSIYIATFKRPLALRRALEKQTQNLAEFGHTHIPIVVCSNANPQEIAANMSDEETRLIRDIYKIKNPKSMTWGALDRLIIEEYRKKGFQLHYVDWDTRDKFIEQISGRLRDLFIKYQKSPHLPDPTYESLMRQVTDERGDISLEKIKTILDSCLASNISGIRNFTLALGQGQRMVNVDDDALPIARVVRRKQLDGILAEREEKAKALRTKMYQELSEAARLNVKDEVGLGALFEAIASLPKEQRQAVETIINKYYAYSADGSTGMIPLTSGQIVDSDVEHRVRFDDILHRNLPEFVVAAEDAALQNMDDLQGYQFDLISIDYLRILNETLGASVDSSYAGRILEQDLRGIAGSPHTKPAILKGKKIGIATTHFNGDRDMSGISLLRYYIQEGAKPLDLQRCVDKVIHIETNGFVNPNSQFCYNTASIDNSEFTVPTIGELYRIEEPYYGYLVRAVVGTLLAWSKTVGGHERIPDGTRPNVPHQILNEETATVAWDEYDKGVADTERKFGDSKSYASRMRYLGGQFVQTGRDYKLTPAAGERLSALHRDMAKYLNTISGHLLKTKNGQEISGIEQTIAELMIEFVSSETLKRRIGPNETIYPMNSCYAMRVNKTGQIILYPVEVKELLEGLQKERKTSFIVKEDEPMDTGVNITQVNSGEPIILSNGVTIVLNIRPPPGSTLYVAGTSKTSLEEFLSRVEKMIQNQMVKDGQTLLIWPDFLESFKKCAPNVIPPSRPRQASKTSLRASASGELSPTLIDRLPEFKLSPKARIIGSDITFQNRRYADRIIPKDKSSQILTSSAEAIDVALSKGTKVIIVENKAQMTQLGALISTALVESIGKKPYNLGIATGGTTESLRMVMGLPEYLKANLGRAPDYSNLRMVATLDDYGWTEEALAHTQKLIDEAEAQTKNRLQIPFTYRDEQIHIWLKNILENPEDQFISPPIRFSTSPSEAARLFHFQLSAIGKMLIQYWGIGTNGHGGFNEPDTAIPSVDKALKLAFLTKVQNAGGFMIAGEKKISPVFLRFMAENQILTKRDLRKKLTEAIREGALPQGLEGLEKEWGHLKGHFDEEWRYLSKITNRLPGWSITQGMDDAISRSLYHLVLVNDTHKRVAVQKAIEGNVGNDATISLLRLAENTAFIVERSAAGYLKKTGDYFYYKPQDKSWEVFEDSRIEAAFREKELSSSLKDVSRASVPELIRMAKERPEHKRDIVKLLSARLVASEGEYFFYNELMDGLLYLGGDDAKEAVLRALEHRYAYWHAFKAFKEWRKKLDKKEAIGFTMQAIQSIIADSYRVEKYLAGRYSTEPSMIKEAIRGYPILVDEGLIESLKGDVLKSAERVFEGEIVKSNRDYESQINRIYRCWDEYGEIFKENPDAVSTGRWDEINRDIAAELTKFMSSVSEEDSGVIFTCSFDSGNGPLKFKVVPSKFNILHVHENGGYGSIENGGEIIFSDDRVRGMMYQSPESGGGFVRLDISRGRKIEDIIKTARFLAQIGVNTAKDLILTEAVRERFKKEQGVNLPESLTLAGFLQSIQPDRDDVVIRPERSSPHRDSGIYGGHRFSESAITETVTAGDPRGIHAKTAMKIVTQLAGIPDDTKISIIKGDIDLKLISGKALNETANARVRADILRLGVGAEEAVTVITDGPKAKEALSIVTNIISERKGIYTVKGISANGGWARGRFILAETAADLPKDNMPYILGCRTGDSKESEMFLRALDSGALIGLVIEQGGKTAHLAGLARYANIPCVAGIGNLDLFKGCPNAILDGDNGTLASNSILTDDAGTKIRSSSSGLKREPLNIIYGPAQDSPVNKKDSLNIGSAMAEAIEKVKAWEEAHRLGYRLLPEQPEELLSAMEDHVASRIASGVTDVVLLGIGGQYSTNKTLQDSLSPSLYNALPQLRNGRPRIHMFGHNVDPVALDAYIKKNNLDPKTTDMLINSKSGNTVEVMTNAYFFLNWMVEISGEKEALKHITVLTNDNEPVTGLLGNFFSGKEVERFYIPTRDNDVGGRFSILAPSSLISALYAGIDVRSLLAGACDMKLRCAAATAEERKNNPAITMAISVYRHLANNDKDLFVISSFSEKLRSAADFLKQLYGESLGKDGKGIFPCIATGTDSVNYLMKSRPDKIFFFLNYTYEPVYLPEGMRHPFIMVDIPSLDAYNLGQLMFLCEDFTVWLGALIGIDPLVQPKVQLAKEITEESLLAGDRTGDRRDTVPTDSIELEGEGAIALSADMEKRMAEAVSYLDMITDWERRKAAAASHPEGGISKKVMDSVEQAFAYIDRSRAKQITDIIFIGTRESILKIRAVCQALASPLYNTFASERRGAPRIHFVDETKGESIEEITGNLDLSKTLIHHLGRTTDSRRMEHLTDLLADRFKGYPGRMLRIPADIALLNEALSGHGLTFQEAAACAMFGVDKSGVLEFIKGYTDYPEDIAKKLAVYSYLLYRDAGNTVKTVNIFFAYCEQLGFFGSWAKQRYRAKFSQLQNSPVIDTAIGSTDQHSILEPMLNWKNKIFTVFLRFKDLGADFMIEKGRYAEKIVPGFMLGRTGQDLADAMQEGVSRSLTNDGRPNLTIAIPKMNPENLGRLFAIVEKASDFECELFSREFDIKDANPPDSSIRRLSGSGADNTPAEYRRGYTGGDYRDKGYDPAKYELDKMDTIWEAARSIFTDVIPREKIASAKILDCATGTGMIASLAVEAGAQEVAALDESPNMLNAAEERIRRIPNHAVVRFVQGNMFEMDNLLRNPDGSPEEFDYITIGNVLAFYDDRSKEEFLRLTLKHLKSEGRLIILERTYDISKKDKVVFFPGDYEVSEDYKVIMKPYVELLRKAGYGDISVLEGSEEYDEDWGMEISELKTLVNTNVLLTAKKQDIVVTEPSGEGIEAVMDRINKENIGLIPPIEKGKTLWHVMPLSLIPRSENYNQRTKFVEFVNELNRRYPNVREKMKVVTDKQDLADVVKELANDPINIVDVALDDRSWIENSDMPDVPMLVFEPEGGKLGDFRQLEGVLASLRALHIEDYRERIEKLTMLHELLTGKAPANIPAKDASLKDFARSFIFILPPITIKDKEELQRLNENLLKLIESA